MASSGAGGGGGGGLPPATCKCGAIITVDLPACVPCISSASPQVTMFREKVATSEWHQYSVGAHCISIILEKDVILFRPKHLGKFSKTQEKNAAKICGSEDKNRFAVLDFALALDTTWLYMDHAALTTSPPKLTFGGDTKKAEWAGHMAQQYNDALVMMLTSKKESGRVINELKLARRQAQLEAEHLAGLKRDVERGREKAAAKEAAG